MTASRDATVLCVDPTGETAGVFDGAEGLDTLAVETAADAREAVENRRVDCVVAEYDLSDATGFELFDQLRETQPNLGCILYTATAYGEMGPDASGSTVAEYVPKSGPGAAARLVETVRSVVGERTQAGFPLPPEEDQRLATLAKYDVPDLETTETFDRISRLVASHFDVTVAFVGLVDEYEERFLACHGADWDRLSREDTICTYAMLEEDVTVIEDVQADPRFEHNETLRSLGIRSYAGATIAAPNGQAIGQLCVTNEQPRSYTAEEQRDLQLFADEVAEQLELRRRLREAEETDGGEQP